MTAAQKKDWVTARTKTPITRKTTIVPILSAVVDGERGNLALDLLIVFRILKELAEFVLDSATRDSAILVGLTRVSTMPLAQCQSTGAMHRNRIAIVSNCLAHND